MSAVPQASSILASLGQAAFVWDLVTDAMCENTDHSSMMNTETQQIATSYLQKHLREESAEGIIDPEVAKESTR